MAKFIDAARDLADLILFDVPSCDGVIDPAIVASQVDGVIMVTGYENASRSKYIEAAELLEDANARIVGIVSMDDIGNKPARRRKALDLSAKAPGSQEQSQPEHLKLLSEDSDEAIVVSKWRKPSDVSSEELPQPVAQPVKESNYVFSPTGETNGNGHKSINGTNGASSNGASGE
jgi:hypothetical protein